MESDTQGARDVPADLAYGMLRLFLGSLLAGRFERVQIVTQAALPRPPSRSRVRRPWVRELLRDGAWAGSETKGGEVQWPISTDAPSADTCRRRPGPVVASR